MTKIYKKKNKNTLEITDTVNETHITEESRADIQTKLDHLELDKARIQLEIDSVKAKLTILDS